MIGWKGGFVKQSNLFIIVIKYVQKNKAYEHIKYHKLQIKRFC